MKNIYISFFMVFIALSQLAATDSPSSKGQFTGNHKIDISVYQPQLVRFVLRPEVKPVDSLRLAHESNNGEHAYGASNVAKMVRIFTALSTYFMSRS